MTRATHASNIGDKVGRNLASFSASHRCRSSAGTASSSNFLSKVWEAITTFTRLPARTHCSRDFLAAPCAARNDERREESYDAAKRRPQESLPFEKPVAHFCNHFCLHRTARLSGRQRSEADLPIHLQPLVNCPHSTSLRSLSLICLISR